MTMDAYQSLYCSSIAFGMRKALQAEQGKADLEAEISSLKDSKESLEKQVLELRLKGEQTERRASEMREAEEKKHQEELTQCKKANAQLKVSTFLVILNKTIVL